MVEVNERCPTRLWQSWRCWLGTRQAGSLRACQIVLWWAVGAGCTCLHLSSWLPSVDSKAAVLDLPASSSLNQLWRVWGTVARQNETITFGCSTAPIFHKNLRLASTDDGNLCSLKDLELRWGCHSSAHMTVLSLESWCTPAWDGEDFIWKNSSGKTNGWRHGGEHMTLRHPHGEGLSRFTAAAKQTRQPTSSSWVLHRRCSVQKSPSWEDCWTTFVISKSLVWHYFNKLIKWNWKIRGQICPLHVRLEAQ